MEIKKLKNGNYEIDKETLEEFLYSYHTLNALECGGVDNWHDYRDALNDYLSEDEDWDDFIQNLINEIK
jgi:hypothetical protein|nr:MAG TPA: hypothetical protein [Ackermannviridae sp.]DAW82269.1 MAG TPA: hypothetical protein [Bacteriophage sp.]